MNVQTPAAIVHGRLDPAGRLVEADARLTQLNDRAGGGVGRPLAIPALASLARLAGRLDVLIARSVTIADGDDDLELWVRAEPDAEGVRLSLSGWHYQHAWTPAAEAEADTVSGDGDWQWAVDGALRLTRLSDVAASAAGLAVGDLLGQPLTRLFALGEGAAGTLPLIDALATQAGFRDQHAVLRGAGRSVLLDAVARLDSEGRFAGFVGNARWIELPVVDEIVADSGLPPAFGEHLDRALRAPLGRIVANADSISAETDGPVQPEYAGYATDIANAARHLMGLVDDLVDLQFVERAEFSVAGEDVDLADVARRAAGLLAVRGEARGVRIERPDASVQVAARGEFRRVLQILVNLIGNAIRYSPEGGTVWLRVQRDGPVAVVIVGDQGRGIAIADQARIFEKFGRVDENEPGGTGLGLYISRRLARAMGGDLIVDSAPGEGARFVLTLPVADA